MSQNLVERIFSAADILKEPFGELGKPFGFAGAPFGFAGEPFGEEGMENDPKPENMFNLNEHFNLAEHFDMAEWFNPLDLISDAMGSVI